MTTKPPDGDAALDLALRLAGCFKVYEQVEAVTLSGSRTSGVTIDTRSDIDIFVYSQEGGFPLDARRNIVEHLGGAEREDLGLPYWGDGDAWFDRRSGIEVDVVYASLRATQEELERRLVHYQPSSGYTTCTWHSVRTAHILFDRSGQFERMRAWSDRPYPPELRQAIIDYNLPLLRAIIPSYRWNLEKSLPRSDLVFINNEVTYMLAAYFDVLFAYNSVPHPGAKRLPDQAARLCTRAPAGMADQVSEVLRLAGNGSEVLLAAVDRLVDGLEALVLSKAGE